MASVERRVKGGQVRYLARWRDPDGAARSKTFAKKRDAERHLVGIEHSMLVGAYVDPVAGKVTLGDFYAEWASRQSWRPGTADTHVMTQRRIAGRLGRIPLTSLRRSHVETWIKEALETYAPGTVTNDIGRLRQVLKAAMVDGVIGRDPSLGIKPPGHSDAPMAIPSTARVGTLLDAFTDEFRVAAVLMAFAGLRIGEACGIGLEHVDFLRRTVTVNQQIQVRPGQPLGKYPPKTPASYRTIPLEDLTLQLLAEHLSAHPTDDLLVMRADGRPVSPSFMGHAFNTAVERSGGGSWTPHSLRHFYASMLIAGGESVRTVCSRMGHSNAAITLKTYAHLWPESDEVTRRIVSTTAAEILCTQGVPREAGQG